VLPIVLEEKKDDGVEELDHQYQNYNKISMTPTSYLFHAEIEKLKRMSSSVSC
jgi:hypothetical protein